MTMNNLILAIESTGDNCGVAIGDIDNIFYELSLNIKHSHDKKLAVMIKQSFSFLDIEVSSLSAVAISSGPGSFTGLRVGGAIAKGLTFNDNPKLIAVPTLSSLAFNAKDYLNIYNKDLILPIIPSNRENYFVQSFNSSAEHLSIPEIKSKDEIEKILTEDMLVCGPGSKDFIDESNLLSELSLLTPKNILKFAQNDYLNERFINSEEFSPRYYQDFKPTQKKSK
jgi:tRNA threonylcarbamoyladenosine biosynthesis protein TsaB